MFLYFEMYKNTYSYMYFFYILHLHCGSHLRLPQKGAYSASYNLNSISWRKHAMATCFYLAIQLENTEIFPYFRTTASCNILCVILFLLNISVLPYMEDCKMFSYIFMFVINSINMFSWIVFVVNIYLHFLSFVSKKNCCIDARVSLDCIRYN